jgi:DNA-binding NtrC family response regulator
MIKEPEGEQVAVRDFQVLVVDDEKSILDLTTEILSGEGFKVKAMDSPLDALRAIKLHRFDALILDIYMPELPGLLFHAKLKFLDSELARRTIFISGHFNREELRDHIEKSALFLPKPFEPELLVAMLREVLPEKPRS